MELEKDTVALEIESSQAQHHRSIRPKGERTSHPPALACLVRYVVCIMVSGASFLCLHLKWRSYWPPKSSGLGGISLLEIWALSM